MKSEEKVNKKVREWLQNDIIEEVEYFSNWVFTITPIVKNNRGYSWGESCGTNNLDIEDAFHHTKLQK